jgi:DNA-binding NarL/FixJ family response regulator
MTRATNQTRELSESDVALLGLLAQGLSVDSAARRLHTSDRTVRRRVKEIRDRLGLSSSIEAIVWAARRGLV